MAYQPKSYRKFVATAATATLVASAVAPAAAAGFTDVSDRYSEAVNYLVENDITSGFTETTFGVSKEVKRGDAAVMIAKALGLDGSKSPDAGFSDVPARAKEAVNALKEAGIFNGKSATNFGFNDTMTRGEMALVIAKAYKLEGDVTLKFTDVSDRYESAVKALVDNKITTGKTETSFGTGDNITRGEFAIFLYRAEVPETPPVVEVEGVSAIAAKQLEVKFNTAVDTAKAELAVKKGTSNVGITNVTFSEDKKSAVIETSSKLTEGTYDVSVSGLTEKAISGSVKVENERVEEIKFSADYAIDTDTGVVAGYKVLNQYGEDISKSGLANITVSASAAVSATASNGTVQVTGTYKADEKVTITLVDTVSGKSVSAVLTVVAEAKPAKLTVEKLYSKNGKALTEDTAVDGNFYLVVNVEDQYGNKITDASALNTGNAFTKVASNPAVSLGNFATEVIDNQKVLVLPLDFTGTVLKGDYNFTLVSNATGTPASYSVSVEEGTKVDTVAIGTPDVSVIAGGEELLVPVDVTDNKGNTVTDLKTLKAGLTPNVGEVVVKDGKAYIKTTTPAVTDAEGSKNIVLTVQTETNKIQTKVLQVKPNAKPAAISGLKSTVSTTMYPTASKSLDLNSFVLLDQYGRIMPSATVVETGNVFEIGGSEYRIVSVDDTDVATISATGATAADTTAGIAAITVTGGANKGSEFITFKLQKRAASSDVATDWADVANSSQDIKFTVVEKSEFVSYEVTQNPTVYAFNTTADDYAVDFKVYGVTSSGLKVELEATDYNVVYNNSAITIDKVEASVYANHGVDADASGDVSVGEYPASALVDTDATTTKPETAEVPVKVIINATGDELATKVTVSATAPKVAKAEYREGGVWNGTAISTLEVDYTDSIAGGVLDIADLYTNLYLEDQYGLKAAVSNAGTVSFADDLTADTNVKLTYSNVVNFDGDNTKPVISNNGLVNASIADAGLEVNDTVDVKFTVGTVTHTVKVKIVD